MLTAGSVFSKNAAENKNNQSEVALNPKCRTKSAAFQRHICGILDLMPLHFDRGKIAKT